MLSKTFLLLLVITIGSSYESHSQTGSNDTLCFPLAVVRQRLTEARLYRYTDSLLKITEAQVAELEGRIKLLNDKDIELKAMYDGQLEALHKEEDIYKQQIKGYETLLKKERRKRRWAIIGGAVATGGALYLYITK